ncbi:MAG TPA: PIG-L family deacetylase [Blastocatellia bacterium]|nr:PIG-L family deacetylase [Blastocatellia bacterium]
MKLALLLITTLTFALVAPARSLFLTSSTSLSDRIEVAEAPQDERGIIALDQALREITSPFTVLCVAARPGDEDDGSLAYLRKKLGARTVMLFATRGEGEDSPTRPELNEELGALHTREAIEAARIAGSDIFFLNLRDIGYSKSPDEPLSVWGHDEALRRMVRAFRLLRPDVVITPHDATTGEGAEQAVARLAREAFTASPNMNEDTRLSSDAGSDVWQVRRFFARTDEGGASAGSEVALNLKEYDRVRGLSYAQMGLAAHRRFLSRGASFDRLTADRETSFYKLIASRSDETLRAGSGLLDGITLTQNVARSVAPPRVGDNSAVDSIAAGDRLVDALIDKLIEKRAEGSIETMHERYGPEFVRVVRFTSAVERALVLALGLNLDVSLSDQVVVPGQKLNVRASLSNGSKRGLPVAFSAPERLPAPENNPTYKEPETTGVATGAVISQDFEYEIAKDAAQTLPQAAHLYDQEFYAIGSSLPGAQPAREFGDRVVVSAEVGLGQVSVRLSALARFDVAPVVELSTIPFALVKDWSTPRDIEFPVRVRNRTPGPLAGALWVVPLAISNDEYEPVHIAFAREDEVTTIKLKLKLPISKPPISPDVLLEFRRERPAPPEPLGSATIAVKAINFQSAEPLNVGSITGVDDWLSFALNQLGVDHSELSVEAISSTEHGGANGASQSLIGCGDLYRFDSIVIDNNAYFNRPDLMTKNRCLLRYVRQGGNLIVLGQQPNDWNLLNSSSQLSPYLLKLSRARITNEASAVKIVDSGHALMQLPNKIVSADFEGWVVNRASDVPREWSSEYAPLLETGDPGDEVNRGTLLMARASGGSYIYTSLALRRQLLNGNGGAYRLFANLVSLSKTSKAPKSQ